PPSRHASGGNLEPWREQRCRQTHHRRFGGDTGGATLPAFRIPPVKFSSSEGRSQSGQIPNLGHWRNAASPRCELSQLTGRKTSAASITFSSPITVWVSSRRQPLSRGS